MYPANAVSFFENRHFLTHRPQLFRTANFTVRTVNFTVWTVNFTVRTVNFTVRIRSRPRGILCVDTIGSPHRGILCVEKIGSVAPELQERPGTPSKPVKSTNGPFYWLTRKRAPPCGWTLSLDPCRWTPVTGPL